MSDIISIALCPAAGLYPNFLSIFFCFPFSRPVYNLRSPSPSSKTQNFGWDWHESPISFSPAKDSSGGGPTTLSDWTNVVSAGQQVKSKLGKDWMRLEANYMYKAEDGESGSSRQHCWVRHWGYRSEIDPAAAQHKQKNSLPLRRSAIGIHPHELSNFYRE